MTLVASDTQTLLVYEETSLKWAAQLPFNPAHLHRGTFKVSEIHNSKFIIIYFAIHTPK